MFHICFRDHSLHDKSSDFAAGAQVAAVIVEALSQGAAANKVVEIVAGTSATSALLLSFALRNDGEHRRCMHYTFKDRLVCLVDM